MLELVKEIDQNIFFFINRDLSNPFFDWLMPFLRNRYFWIPLYLFIVILLTRKYRRTGLLIILFMGITFGIADYFSASILKPAFQRLRPCNDPLISAKANLLIDCGTGYSLPSSHAANHFALAAFMIALFFNKWKPILPLAVLWALSICIAQVYVGVHYPFDVTFGGVIGSLIGYLMCTAMLQIKIFKTWKSES